MEYINDYLLLESNTIEKDIEVTMKSLEKAGVICKYKEQKINGIIFKKLLLKIPVYGKNQRYAGRKEKVFGPVRTEILQKEIKEIGIEEVVKLYGVSRATIYRRLKEAKEKGSEWI